MASVRDAATVKPDKTISFKSIAQGDVTHGWLRKQTSGNRTLEKLSKSIINSKYQWPKRIVVLKRGCLYAYKNEHDAKPCVAVSLYGFTKIEKLVERRDKPYQRWGFSIEHAQEFEGSILRFAALSEQDRQDWLARIQTQIDFANTRSGRPLPPPPVPKRISDTPFDDDQPDAEDAYWSIKQAMQSRGEISTRDDKESWPQQAAPPPPLPARVSLKRNSAPNEYQDLNGGLFGQAFSKNPTAERMLDHVTEDGVYVIRDHSDTPGRKTLSIKSNGAIKKYAINNENGEYFLEMEKIVNGTNANKFRTMDDLIQHYQTCFLPAKQGSGNVKLMMPYSLHPNLQGRS